MGTDEGVDGATATYSDGDMNATALAVSLAAAPLWNAEFDLTDAPEADKAGKWSTDIPEGGVVKGTEVKVTYTGSKKVIGVKAEKKAAPTVLRHRHHAQQDHDHHLQGERQQYRDPQRYRCNTR